MLYLLSKAAHLISIVFWFAGLLYLPRILVYGVRPGSGRARSTLVLMSTRLYRRIMGVAMVAVLATGLLLLSINSAVALGGYWFMIKLLLIVGLLSFHIYAGRLVKRFEKGLPLPNERLLLWLNELPALLLLIIVLLAVLKPF